MKRLTAMALAMLCTVMPAHAQSVTGTQLLEYCQSKNPSLVFACQMYIAGVADSFGLSGVRSKRIVFAREGLAVEQQRELVVVYLRKYPQIRPLLGAIIVENVLMAAYDTEIMGQVDQPQTQK